MKTTRQNFLKTSALVGAAAGFPSIIPSTVLGQAGKVAPSNRVTVGALACGGMAGANWSYVNYEKAQVVAVCDPVKERRDQRGSEWKVAEKDRYNDFEELLARDDIDAVHIATPDHWHVPLALAAARAGKDMYVEKPLGLSIEQCLSAREITKTHNRIFQYGTQQRSMAHLRLGIELVLNGHIGDVKDVYVWCPPGNSGGSATAEPVPEGLDYNRWLGPAPEAPYCNDRVYAGKNGKGVYFVYDYSIGFIAGWGAHPVDQLQWWADAAGLGIPIQYETKGTIPTEGLFTAVTHWDMEAQYANGIKLHFMDTKTAKESGKVPNMDRVGRYGDCTMFMGTKGWVAVSRAGWEVSSEEIRRKARDAGPIKLKVSTHHQQNFIDSVISREEPVTSLESSIKSDIICHMGDIGVRTGKVLKWDPKKETIVGDKKAVAMMHRAMREPWSL